METIYPPGSKEAAHHELLASSLELSDGSTTIELLASERQSSLGAKWTRLVASLATSFVTLFTSLQTVRYLRRLSLAELVARPSDELISTHLLRFFNNFPSQNGRTHIGARA